MADSHQQRALVARNQELQLRKREKLDLNTLALAVLVAALAGRTLLLVGLGIRPRLVAAHLVRNLLLLQSHMPGLHNDAFSAQRQQGLVGRHELKMHFPGLHADWRHNVPDRVLAGRSLVAVLPWQVFCWDTILFVLREDVPKQLDFEIM